MNKILLTLLEHTSSRYLALDREALKQLATLSGKVLKLQLTDWNIIVYLSPNLHGIKFTDYCEKADVELQGSSFDFLRIMANKKNQTAAMKQLTIKGDLHLAQQFSKILQQLQINWEELLAKFTGDIVAHQLGSTIRSLKRWGLKRKTNFLQNVTEYLQEESSHLPAREAIEDFFTAVTRLQHDVERLEKTLKLVGETHDHPI